MRRDLAFALRTLARARGFSLAAGAILALGIGVAATIFSAVDGLLLRPPPYDAPERVVAVHAEHRERGMTRAALDWPDAVDVRAASRTLTELAVVRPTSVNLAGLADAARAERASGARVSDGFFRVFGVRPLLGRGLVAEDAADGRARVVVLGEAMWRARLGGDASVVGRALTLNGEPYTVVGVMPARFEHPTGAQLWVPFVPEPFAQDRGSRYLSAVARLAPDATIDGARAELGAIAARLARAYPASNAGWGLDVAPVMESLAAELRPILALLAGGAGCVLLVACANVANLLFARGAARAGELALRRAVGATRGRLVRQLLVESVLLALAGAAAGAALAAALVGALRGAVPVPLPGWIALEVSGRALAFVVALAVAAGILAGIAPALRLAAADAHATLVTRRTSARRGRAQRGIVVAQVALAVALLAAAGLLAASLARLRAVSPGFDASGVLAARVAPAGPRYADRDAVARFHAAVLARVRAAPGVVAAGATGGLPLASGANRFLFALEGQPRPAPGSEPSSRWERVTPGYLATLRIPVLQGRDLEGADRAGVPDVALVSASWARAHVPGGGAVGRRFRSGDGAWTTIVGVVGDVRHDALEQAGEPTVYTPLAQQPYAEMTVVARADCDPDAECDAARLVAAVRAAVRAVDPGVPVYDVATLREVVSRATLARRLGGAAIGAFAGLALLLAAAGVYGLVAFQVAQRRREIGIRLALGARRGDVRRLVVGEGVRLAAAGVAVGLAAALGAGRALGGMLYGVGPAHVPTLVAVSVTLLAAAALASWVPAGRVSRTDPGEVLRGD